MYSYDSVLSVRNNSRTAGVGTMGATRSDETQCHRARRNRQKCRPGPGTRFIFHASPGLVRGFDCIHLFKFVRFICIIVFIRVNIIPIINVAPRRAATSQTLRDTNNINNNSNWQIVVEREREYMRTYSLSRWKIGITRRFHPPPLHPPLSTYRQILSRQIHWQSKIIPQNDRVSFVALRLLGTRTVRYTPPKIQISSGPADWSGRWPAIERVVFGSYIYGEKLYLMYFR